MPTIEVLGGPEGGYVERYVGHQTWNELRNGVGTHKGSPSTFGQACDILAGSVENEWTWLYRCLVAFPTEEVPSGIDITAVRLKMVGTYKSNTLGASPSLVVVTTSGVDPEEIVIADYSNLTDTAASDTIAYGDWVIDVYNTFTLNATGRAFIDLEAPTVFGIRENAYDRANSAPPWVSAGRIRMTGKAVLTIPAIKCKLEIDYTGKRIWAFVNP